MSRKDFEGLREAAKRDHDARVAKTPERISYAEMQFERHGIRYELKNEITGHFHVWDPQGRLYQFWAGTGKILGEENRRGIHQMVKMIQKRKEEYFK